MKDVISVIIPAYNAEKFIDRSLSSVLNQTYNNIEIIVVNDGSSDSTQAIVKDFQKNNGNIVLINKDNGGVSSARNLGIENAKGEYVVFLDADDVLLPDSLETMLRIIHESNADIVSTLVSLSETEKCSEVVVWDTETAIMNVIKDHPATYTACGKLYKTEKIRNIKFPINAKFGEDCYFIFLCIINKLKIAICNTTTYIYYQNLNSATRSGFSENIFVMVSLSKSKKEIIDSEFPQFKNISTNILIKTYMALLRNLVKTNDKKYSAMEKEYISFIIENKAKYIVESNQNDLWFNIITFRLYPIYKLYYRLIHKIK